MVLVLDHLSVLILDLHTGTTPRALRPGRFQLPFWGPAHNPGNFSPAAEPALGQKSSHTRRQVTHALVSARAPPRHAEGAGAVLVRGSGQDPEGGIAQPNGDD